MSEKADQLKKNLSDTDVSGYSPAVLQHQGIKALADNKEDSMADLTSQQITSFAILRAYNEMVPIPKTMTFIENYLSLSRARDRKGRLEYAGCYKSYPGFVMGGQGMPFMQEQHKPNIVSRFLKGRKNEEQQQ